MKKHILVVMLLLSFVFTGCSDGISIDGQGSKKEGIIDLSLEIFNENLEDENILISPLSIVSALGMLGNGADGDTLAQMEDLLNSDIEGFNKYLNAYTSYLPSGKKYKVGIANSIWFKDEESLTIEKDFLKVNKDYYNADVYKAPFDESTKEAINDWVKDKTSGMIETLLEEAPDKDAVMYLINALSFDAEWEKIYEDTQIHDGEFTRENGEKQAVEFMRSTEFSYLENEHATGFMKPYEGNKYAFVALLPNEDMSIKEFLASFEAKDYKSILGSKKDEKVFVTMPKFSVEYDTLLNESLKSLGMVDAFIEDEADFISLGKSDKGNIYVNRVIHKTKIDVDERGTKAGAVTAVEMMEKTSIEEEPKMVNLDRPFFYMIIDTEHGLPLFMGSLMKVN